MVQFKTGHAEVEERERKREVDAERSRVVKRNRNVKAETKFVTNPSAFLPSRRAAAAASFFRFSSSFTFFS